MRLGIAHHYGWATAVLATMAHHVVDRRRIELVDSALPAAPVHHQGSAHELHRTGPQLDDQALALLVRRVRESAVRCAAVALDEIELIAPEPIVSVSVRAWPPDFPTDISVLRRAPYESRADSVMYCQVLAETASSRGWSVDMFDAKTVERDATVHLQERAHDVLHGPRKRLGAPWNKDHRTALAATIMAT